jgi:hypothetical protein
MKQTLWHADCGERSAKKRCHEWANLETLPGFSVNDCPDIDPRTLIDVSCTPAVTSPWELVEAHQEMVFLGCQCQSARSMRVYVRLPLKKTLRFTI